MGWWSKATIGTKQGDDATSVVDDVPTTRPPLERQDGSRNLTNVEGSTPPKPEPKGNFFTQAGTLMSNNPGKTALGLGAVGALGVGAMAFMGSSYQNGSAAGTGATGSTSGGYGSDGGYGSGGAMVQSRSLDLLTQAITQGQSQSSDLSFYDKFQQRLLNDTSVYGGTVQNTSMTHNIPAGNITHYNITTTPSVSDNTTSTGKPQPKSETLQELLG